MSVCFLTLLVSVSLSELCAGTLAEGGSQWKAPLSAARRVGGRGRLASPVGTQPVPEEPVHEVSLNASGANVSHFPPAFFHTH